MKSSQFVLFSMLVVICSSQRSPYAGRRPIGYPEITTTTTQRPQNDTLGNRLGEVNGTTTTTTTQRLPIEALGDRNLFNRLGKVPVDKQPFWFINWQALEQQRQRPQSYPQRPNVFAQSMAAAQTQTVQN